MGGGGRLGHGNHSDCLSPVMIAALDPAKKKQTEQEEEKREQVQAMTIVALQQMLKAEVNCSED